MDFLQDNQKWVMFGVKEGRFGDGSIMGLGMDFEIQDGMKFADFDATGN